MKLVFKVLIGAVTCIHLNVSAIEKSFEQNTTVSWTIVQKAQTQDLINNNFNSKSNVDLQFKLPKELYLSSPLKGQDRGGGDSCERKIQNIIIDIYQWVYNGGGNDLKSLDKSQVTPDQFRTKMLTVMTKEPAIECTHDKITVYGSTKTCEFIKSEHKIRCNNQLLMSNSVNDKYRDLFHEVAGIAGLEAPNGSTSQYHLANQISKYLVVEEVKKLAIKKLTPIESIEHIGEYALPTFNEDELISSFKIRQYLKAYYFNLTGLLRPSNLLENIHFETWNFGCGMNEEENLQIFTKYIQEREYSHFYGDDISRLYVNEKRAIIYSHSSSHKIIELVFDENSENIVKVNFKKYSDIGTKTYSEGDLSQPKLRHVKFARRYVEYNCNDWIYYHKRN